MKKSLLVLLLAVLLPSLLLGWLALRSTEEQQIVLERRTAELYQKETDQVATTASSLINEQRRVFGETLRQFLAEEKPKDLAVHFTTLLRTRWPQPAVGFAIDRTGHLFAPTTRDAALNTQCRQFLEENGAFLGNRTAATAYAVPPDELNRPGLALQRKMEMGGKSGTGNKGEQSLSKAQSKEEDNYQKRGNAKDQALADNQSQKEATRNVAPQQQPVGGDSQLTWATAEFREFTAEGSEGVVNRFVEDRLNMIFWVRPAVAPEMIFGCLLRVEDLRPQWVNLFPPTETDYSSSTKGDPEFILALLDDKAQPVAVHPAKSAVQEWKKPFVATEVGEALPHWEAALYLLHPERLRDSARHLRRNLSLLIACALAAIAIGGWVIFADTRRQLALAQKRTDFVSNVSHELKTPLTSIRMFAEMMHSGRASTERQPEYLRIIMVEAERLTRLINNVLDFAKLERRQRRFEKRPLDLHEMLSQLWPAQELHLREAGFAAKWESAEPSLPVVGDEDALAQVLVNLLSNAEKYGGATKEVTLHSYLAGDWVCVSVLDRGAGVPAGEEAKIFEPFYRAHDSLSSGIPGTGLGLALAHRVIREHGGEIVYHARPDGGSNFTIRLPKAGRPNAGATPEMLSSKS